MKRILNLPAATGIDWAVVVHAGLVSLSLCLPGTASSSSSVDICQEPAAESHLSIAYYNQEASSFDGNPGETNLENYDTDILFQRNERWSFGAGHRYTILNIDQIELQTNGYLHTFFFPAHKLSQSDKRGFRLSIAPAFSASSNVVSDLDEYTIDAVQLLAALVWNRQLADRLDLHYGVCGDHRLGDYQVYPVINFRWQIKPDWLMEIGFPTSQVTHAVSENLTSSMRITPNGNEWYVKNKSLKNHSQLVYEAYILEWAFSWRTHENFMLAASLGREFHRQYEMTLLDESRVRLSSASATRVGVAMTWVF